MRSSASLAVYHFLVLGCLPFPRSVSGGETGEEKETLAERQRVHRCGFSVKGKESDVGSLAAERLRSSDGFPPIFLPRKGEN